MHGTPWRALCGRWSWARNGYLVIFRPIPDLILAAQRLYLPWESLWQPLDELFGVAIVGRDDRRPVFRAGVRRADRSHVA
ncbi:MAG: hypothetical protein KatS3mg082_0898 [Nitrospiraceae bacterium]|nr:MAG: hypothetical protein KatS3mg082_0898 [Nitrospiraceae bacterium]